MSVIRYLRTVARHGIPAVQGLIGAVFGVGIVGVAAWASHGDPFIVLLAAALAIFAVFSLGSYRAWCDAERFRPSWEICQGRADTLSAFIRVEEYNTQGLSDHWAREAQTLARYHAGHAHSALHDFDRAATAGYLEPSHRARIMNPRLDDLVIIAALFADAAQRWKAAEE